MLNTSNKVAVGRKALELGSAAVSIHPPRGPSHERAASGPPGVMPKNVCSETKTVRTRIASMAPAYPAAVS